MNKPIFAVDIAEQSKSALESHAPLALASEDGCYHHMNGLRLPLGIYNVSVARSFDRLLRLCTRMERYFQTGSTLQSLQGSSDLAEEIVDHMELALFAAAEHVDDIDSIASGFFNDKATKERNPAFKQLTRSMKTHKRFVAAAANAIKHQQSRLRLYTLEFSHGGTRGCLHGYFIEGVKGGVVGPSETLHRHQEIFSITTLPWEILIFLMSCSRDLTQFLQVVSKQIVGPPRQQVTRLTSAVIAAARLPLYTFGEEHPFSRVSFHIKGAAEKMDILDSRLYGSIGNQWVEHASAVFGQDLLRFSGDGVTKQFRLGRPNNVVLQNWRS